MRAETINAQTGKNIALKRIGPSIIQKRGATNPSNGYAEKLPIENINASHISANFLPISFRGNAPKIKRAYLITSREENIPIDQIKKNNSYLVEFDTQTEVIYGVDAIKFLNTHKKFDYDTQIVFPKKAEGVLYIDDKEIPLDENSAVLLKEDTEAKIEVKKGYPFIIITKQDHGWYERHNKNAANANIRNKFEELRYYNAHVYNGEFTPNIMLPERLRDEKFLKSVSIDKWQSRNNLVYDLYEKREMLGEEDKKAVECAKECLDKMYSAGIIEAKADGFIGFRKLYTAKYMQNVLKEAGLNEQEIKMITPIIQQARQAHLETKISIRADKKGLNEELIQKMQDSGILYKPQKQTEYIYWKTLYANEEELKKALIKNGFNESEQTEIIEHWKKTNITGYDISGLKFINENAAVYNLNNKLNNWTQEKTAWVTNSTEMSGLGENTPSVGISMVQYDKESPVSMHQLRREEKLHTHPKEERKSQREIYLITSGEAALNVVKNGKTHVEILREGDLAVVGEGVSHCVNSLHGEYEQIVAQVPSAFQYGFEFKTPVEPPKDYDEKELQQRAFSELRIEHAKRGC